MKRRRASQLFHFMCRRRKKQSLCVCVRGERLCLLSLSSLSFFLPSSSNGNGPIDWPRSFQCNSFHCRETWPGLLSTHQGEKEKEEKEEDEAKRGGGGGREGGEPPMYCLLNHPLPSNLVAVYWSCRRKRKNPRSEGDEEPERERGERERRRENARTRDSNGDTETREKRVRANYLIDCSLYTGEKSLESKRSHHPLILAKVKGRITNAYKHCLSPENISIQLIIHSRVPSVATVK